MNRILFIFLPLMLCEFSCTPREDKDNIDPQVAKVSDNSNKAEQYYDKETVEKAKKIHFYKVCMDIENQSSSIKSTIEDILNEGTNTFYFEKVRRTDLSPEHYKHPEGCLHMAVGLVFEHNIQVGGKNVKDLSIFKGLLRVKSIWIEKTLVKDLSPLADMPNLEFIASNQNPIKKFDRLEKLVNLKELILKHNSEIIPNLEPIRKLKEVRDLTISDIGLEDISAIKDFYNLRNFVASDNKISDISALSNLENLYSVYLDNNPIRDISALKNAKEMVQLMLDYTGVTDLSPLQNLPKLKQVNFFASTVRDITPLASIKTLEHIDARYSQVQDFGPLEGKDVSIWIYCPQPISDEIKNPNYEYHCKTGKPIYRRK